MQQLTGLTQHKAISIAVVVVLGGLPQLAMASSMTGGVAARMPTTAAQAVAEGGDFPATATAGGGHASGGTDITPLQRLGVRHYSVALAKVVLGAALAANISFHYWAWVYDPYLFQETPIRKLIHDPQSTEASDLTAGPGIYFVDMFFTIPEATIGALALSPLDREQSHMWPEFVGAIVGWVAGFASSSWARTTGFGIPIIVTKFTAPLGAVAGSLLYIRFGNDSRAPLADARSSSSPWISISGPAVVQSGTTTVYTIGGLRARF